MAILHANGNRNHGSRAELACGVCWNRCHKAAIRKTPRANLHRFEQAGEGAACPNRVHQVSLGEDYWLAGRQICSHYGKRNLQIFELARSCDMEAHWISVPGLGTASLEAMALGLPTMAWTRPGLYEDVPLTDGENMLKLA